MKIAIASDHAGFALKTVVIDHLKAIGVDVTDLGTNDASTRFGVLRKRENLHRSVKKRDFDIC